MIPAESAVKSLLEELGQEVDKNPHMMKTPHRVVEWYEDFLAFVPFNFTCFDSESQDMVVLQDIPFYSLCAHHLLPFFGKAHVAYIPEGRLCGLSKLARAVDQCTRVFGVQEEITKHVADLIEIELEPKGIAVVLQAEHLCVTMRGIKAPGALTTTSAMRGAFLDPSKGARQEFLDLIHRS